MRLRWPGAWPVRPRGLRMSIELVCPAGTPSALRSAVEAGAHAVYCGFRDETNARNFPGLNFSPQDCARACALRMSTARRCWWRQHLRARRSLRALGAGAGERGGGQGRRGDPGRHRGARLLRGEASEPAHPSFGASRRRDAGSHRLLRGDLRREAGGAAARALRGGNRGAEPGDRHRDRGVRLRRLVPDGGGPLRAFLLRDGALAQHLRRLLAARGGRLFRGPARHGGDARRLHHQPLPARAKPPAIRRFAKAASWPAARPPICSKTRPASTRRG